MASCLTKRRTWRRVRVSLVRERAEQPYPIRHGGEHFVGLDWRGEQEQREPEQEGTRLAGVTPE